MEKNPLPITRPNITVTIRLNEPVPLTGSRELQKRIDLVLNGLELIRISFKDLLNHSVTTYCGNPSLDNERFNAEITKRLAEEGIVTDGPGPKALITAVWTMASLL